MGVIVTTVGFVVGDSEGVTDGATVLGIGVFVGATVGSITMLGTVVGDSEGISDVVVGEEVEGKVDGDTLEVTSVVGM